MWPLPLSDICYAMQRVLLYLKTIDKTRQRLPRVTGSIDSFMNFVLSAFLYQILQKDYSFVLSAFLYQILQKDYSFVLSAFLYQILQKDYSFVLSAFLYQILQKDYSLSF